MANRFLNNITINDAYTFPSTDGSDGQAIITDGAGNLSFGSVAAASADSAESTHLQVKNTSGSLIAKGTPVYITGNVGNSDRLEIAPADASSASTMPAVGLLETDLANNGEGFVVQGGFLKGLVTATIDGTSTSSNDTVYVKSGGGLTMTKPTGASNFIQNIAKVARVHASNGSLVVSSILRANDVPNLSTGKIWVGDGNTTESTVVHLDETNNRLGINETTPAVTLDISGTDAVQMPAGTTAQRPTAQAGMFRYNTTDGKFEGYTTEWGEIGGGAGTVEIEKNIYTGDGSDTTFDTTTTISSENNVQVYLDGVYQSKDNYTTSGSTVTFSTAPPNGVSIELIHLISVSASIILDTDTGDGSTTAFTLTNSVSNENNTQVYIDGVYQSKDNYSVSGTTLTFSTAPANGASIEVVHIKPVNSTDIDCDTATIAGDLTVDTNTLYVDSTNNRVGIGTVSPNSTVHISKAVTLAASTEHLLIQNTTTGEAAALAFTAVADNGGVGNEGAIYFDAGANGSAANNIIAFNADHQTDNNYDMVIKGDGNVGIGTTSPSEKLHVNGNVMIEGSSPEITFETGASHYNWQIAAQENVDAAFEIGVGSQDDNAANDTFAAKLAVKQNGDLHVDGDVIAASTTVSDERLKDDIKTIDNALEKVESLRGVSYTWNKGNREGEKEIGVVAQEVEQVFPEIVREKEMPLINGESYKTVDYEKLVGVLIEAVKELNQKVEKLENK